MSTNTYKGGCLCGKIRFEIIGEIGNIVYCHCSQCRKVQGSAFATNGNVDVEAFIFLSGEDELTGYQSSPGQTKYFCKHCGSPIISRNESVPNKVRVRLGTIESDIRERPIAHIFITSKANWEELPDNLPQYESFEPGR
ncbi:MAG: GFA family protein [gamma proteobacterium endosymbiont of Lamellibrachia anaximandri]|nr:GFA family protein [gamma proteobacterium endosymbiont of Lamellibrachia anaximandri]